MLSQAEKEPGIGNLLSPLYRHTIWGPHGGRQHRLLGSPTRRNKKLRT